MTARGDQGAAGLDTWKGWMRRPWLGLVLVALLMCVAVLAPGVAHASAVWSEENPGVVPWLAGIATTDDNHAWAVGGNGTIVATTDGGATWNIEASGTTDSLNAVAFSDAQHGWAVGEGGTIVATTDGGAHWSAQDSGTSEELQGVAFANAEDGWASGWNGTIVATTDGGSTWTSQTSGTTYLLGRAACVAPDDVWVTSTSPSLFATTDGGSTWSPQSSVATDVINGVAFTDADTGCAVGNGGTVLLTTDGGSTWTATTTGENQQLEAVAFANPNDGWAVGTDAWGNSTILTTTDGGSSWSAAPAGTAGPLSNVAFSDVYHGWAVGYTSSGDGGIILRYHYPAPVIDVTGSGYYWQSGPANLTVDATIDPSLALTSFQYTTDGGSTWADVPGSGPSRSLPITAEGTTNIIFRASDSAGDTTDQPTQVNIDSSTPTIHVSGNDSAWHRTPVTLTFTPTVGLSGVMSVEYKLNSGSSTLDRPGQWALHSQGVDHRSQQRLVSRDRQRLGHEPGRHVHREHRYSQAGRQGGSGLGRA